MSHRYDPVAYERWYHEPRGAWIGGRECALLTRMLCAEENATLLDVGSGTGYFSRCFSRAGLQVTGLDADATMLQYARDLSGSARLVAGRAEQLPFPPQSFDYVAAITSLCFVSNPVEALHVLWRTARRGMMLGLLNRDSVLHRRKCGRGSYAGARWDTVGDVGNWISRLSPAPQHWHWRTAIFFPDGSPIARVMEKVLPARLPWGGFLAVYLHKAEAPAGDARFAGDNTRSGRRP